MRHGRLIRIGHVNDHKAVFRIRHIGIVAGNLYIHGMPAGVVCPCLERLTRIFDIHDDKPAVSIGRICIISRNGHIHGQNHISIAPRPGACGVIPPDKERFHRVRDINNHKAVFIIRHIRIISGNINTRCLTLCCITPDIGGICRIDDINNHKAIFTLGHIRIIAGYGHIPEIFQCMIPSDIDRPDRVVDVQDDQAVLTVKRLHECFIHISQRTVFLDPQDRILIRTIIRFI